jgi:hypothetical protein
LALIGIFDVPAHESLLGRLSTASRALAHSAASGEWGFSPRKGNPRGRA